MAPLWFVAPIWAGIAVLLYFRFRRYRDELHEHKRPRPSYEVTRFTVFEPDGGVWPVSSEERRISFGTTAKSDVPLPKSKYHERTRPTSFVCTRPGDGSTKELVVSARKPILINGVGRRKRTLQPGDKIFFDDLRIVFDGISTVQPEMPPAPQPTFALLIVPLAVLIAFSAIYREPIRLFPNRGAETAVTAIPEAEEPIVTDKTIDPATEQDQIPTRDGPVAESPKDEPGVNRNQSAPAPDDRAATSSIVGDDIWSDPERLAIAARSSALSYTESPAPASTSGSIQRFVPPDVTWTDEQRLALAERWTRVPGDILLRYSRSQGAMADTQPSPPVAPGTVGTDGDSALSSAELPSHERGDTAGQADPESYESSSFVTAEPVSLFRSRPLEVFGRNDAPAYFDADIMFVHAHPDDEAIDFGGLMAKASRAGYRIVTVIFTDGEAGLDMYPERVNDDDYPAFELEGEALAEIRRGELERSLQVLGAEHAVLLGLRNNPYAGLSDVMDVDAVLEEWGGIAIIERVSELILGYRPDYIVSPDGQTEDALEHFEHEAVGSIVAEAIARLRTRGEGDFIAGYATSVDPKFIENFPDAVGIDVTGIDEATGRSYRDIQLAALRQHLTQRDAAVIAVDNLIAYPYEHYLVHIWNTEIADASALFAN